MNIKDWKIIKWAKRHKWLTVVLLVLLALYVISHNWPYHGRVVDAETGEPIEGAVVVAKWLEERPTIAGPSNWVGDVKEVLTDEKGEWKMRGPKGESPIGAILSFLPMVSETKKPQFIVYKPGYCPWPKGFGIEACRGGISPGSQNEVRAGDTVKLPKLTKREDRLSAQAVGPIFSSDDSREMEILGKQKEFIELLNKERKALGLKAIDYFGEGEYEK